MHIIKPSVKILSATPNAIKLIEKAGRVCYQSDPQGDPVAFVEKILEKGHESVIEHASATVRLVCDRGVTHEIVRHRLAAFSQESTRYCNYNKDKFSHQISVIVPAGLSGEAYKIWYDACLHAEDAYFHLLNQGCSPQMARHVLPISLKAELIMTANFREWRHIFELRTSPAAHPHIRFLMEDLQKQMEVRWPVVFSE